MGHKGKKLELTVDERAALEEGYKTNKSSTFRRRCHMMLLKSEGRSSRDIGTIVGATLLTVDNWVKRFKIEGIQGLKTRPGRGRRPILDKEIDGEKIKTVVKKERQRLSLAKAELEKQTGKSFSLKTLKRFLKNLSADGNVSV